MLFYVIDAMAMVFSSFWLGYVIASDKFFRKGYLAGMHSFGSVRNRMVTRAENQ